MPIESISPVTGFGNDRNAQATRGKCASRGTAHIAPPVTLGFSAGPKFSDLVRSKCRTCWCRFRHTSLSQCKICQRENPHNAVLSPWHHISSSLEKLVFFHMTNGSFPVDILEFWVIFPLTGMTLGKIRKASCRFCVMLWQWDTTVPPVPTASSATHIGCSLTPLQGIMDGVLTPPATKGHHFNQGSRRFEEKMFKSVLGKSLTASYRQGWIQPVFLLKCLRTETKG